MQSDSCGDFFFLHCGCTNLLFKEQHQIPIIGLHERNQKLYLNIVSMTVVHIIDFDYKIDKNTINSKWCANVTQAISKCKKQMENK